MSALEIGDCALNQLLFPDVRISVPLSLEKHLELVGVEGVGWQRSTFSGNDPKHPLGMVPMHVMFHVMLVGEAVEVIVPAMTSKTFQIFLKVFSNLAKGVFLLRRSPKGGLRLERAQFFILQGAVVLQGKQQGPEAGGASDLGNIFKRDSGLRRIVLLTSCCPGCAGEAPGHKEQEQWCSWRKEEELW